MNHNIMNHNIMNLAITSLLASMVPLWKPATPYTECPSFPVFELEKCVPSFEEDIRLGNIIQDPLKRDCGNTPIMYAFHSGNEYLLRSWLQEKTVQHFVRNNPYFRARCCLEKNLSLFEKTHDDIVDLVCSTLSNVLM